MYYFISYVVIDEPQYIHFSSNLVGYGIPPYTAIQEGYKEK